MVVAERRPEEDPKVNLAPLGEMVSVQKALRRLIEQKRPLGKEVVLGVLKSEQEAYSLPALAGRFGKQSLALGEIIGAFEEEQFGVSDLLKAAGVRARAKN